MRFTAPGFEPGPFANSGIHPFLWSRLKHSQLRSPSYKDGALLLSQGGFKLLAETRRLERPYGVNRNGLASRFLTYSEHVSVKKQGAFSFY